MRLGDARFDPLYDRVARASSRTEELARMSAEEVVAALASSAARRRSDAYLSNILATEAMNRVRRAHAILDRIVEGAYAVDVHGTMTYLNASAERMLGWSRGEALGRFAYDLLEMRRLNGDRLRSEEWPLWQAIHAGRIVEGEALFVRRDGASFPATYAWSPLHRDDEVEGAVLTFRDVSARRAAEQASEASERLLQAVLEQLPGGISIARAPGGELLYHNAEAVRLIGHPLLPSPDYRGYKRYGALHADGTPYEAREYPIARALLEGETIRNEPMRYRRGDGRVTSLRVSAAPVTDREGRVIAAVSVFYDAEEDA